MKAGPPQSGGLTAERFARVRDLFGRACDLEASGRGEFLDRECAGDLDLRTRVQDLLRAEERAAEFSDPDRGAIIRTLLAQGDAEPLESVGPYRIRGVVGRGGMGVVYLAEQGSPRRDVALKVLPLGADAPVLESWFGREVRTLGRLEHPGIARIYEAGTADTPRGAVSYFAMEFIAGPRLFDHARDAGLGLRERVGLIAAVADAVQHAHTKGVVHRDLKPANLLVRDPGAARPQPVILDFGVASAAESGGAHTTIAEAGLLIGTIAYMSPEQLAGDNDAVDARADVYSLGVVLYELLTGRLPHAVRGKTPAEAARLVHEAPAARLNAPGERRFPEDLEIIAARTLEKDRERRYATAAALAEDLRRFLRDEPIMARRPSAAYQLRKFARRNRGLVATAAAGVLALAGGLAASATLYVREQQARERSERHFASEQEARRLADDRDRLNAAIRSYLIDGLLMSAAPDRMGYDVKVLDVLASAAEGLHQRFADHPDVEAGVRGDLARVLAAVGRYAESDAQWTLAIPLIEATSGADSREAVAALLGRAAVLHELRRRPAAISLAAEALARARRTDPGGALVVRALSRLGAAYEAEGRHAAALERLREGLALAEQAPEDNAAEIPSLMTYINSAESRRGDRSAALAMSRRIVEFADAHGGPQSPGAIMSRHNLILELLAGGLLQEAAAVAEPLPAAAERAFAPNHLARAQVHRICGEVMRQLERREEAERLLTLADREFGGTFGEVSIDRELCYDALWRLYSSWPGRTPDFRDACERALASRLSHTPPARIAWVRRFLDEIRDASHAAGDPADQGLWLERVWARREELAPPGNASRAMFFANFARLAAARDDRPHFDDAVASARDAMEYAKRPRTAESILARALGRPEPAPADLPEPGDADPEGGSK